MKRSRCPEGQGPGVHRAGDGGAPVDECGRFGRQLQLVECAVVDWVVGPVRGERVLQHRQPVPTRNKEEGLETAQAVSGVAEGTDEPLMNIMQPESAVVCWRLSCAVTPSRSISGEE